LATTAPKSQQALELNAEAFESQGKWDDAAKQYRMILQQNPRTPESISVWDGCCYPSPIHPRPWRGSKERNAAGA